jgi:hypothetical protein
MLCLANAIMDPTADSSPGPRKSPRPRAKRRALWFAGKLALFLLAFWLTVAVLMVFFEESMIFPAPRYPTGDWEPDWLEKRDVNFESSDGTKLHGWYLEHREPRGYLLVCHGNAEHVAYMADFLAALRSKYRLSVFAFDYRGYGRSEGSPNEKGVLEDGEAALAWLAAEAGIEPSDVILLGRSLGGAVAVDLASRHGARALLLDRAFTTAPDVAAHHYRWLPVRMLMRTQLDSLSKIGRYEGPLLITHGADDEIVPVEHGRRLLEAAGSSDKHLVEYPGMRHNDPPPKRYWDDVGQFLDGALE